MLRSWKSCARSWDTADQVAHRPIAVKKCQDDQEFDITQAEILGALFANAATIRLVQAPATSSGRDSVPPESALRYDPLNLGHKRDRPNGSQSPGTRRPNKRQRVSDFDPDRPLQSRERDQYVGGTIDGDEELRDDIIPNSQQEAAYAQKKGNPRHGGANLRHVSETPPPPPDISRFANGSADFQGQKSIVANTNHISMSNMSIPSPNDPASVRAQESARSKSASYHIQSATERGTSVSTAATSPLFAERQGPSMNGTRPSNNGKIPDPISAVPKANGKAGSRSENEDSIYENMPSDSEGSAILRRTKGKLLNGKNGSPSGLPGIAWAKKFNTPPSGRSRSSRSQERIIPNGELPLTPISKEREERQREKEQGDEARKARMAAEQRKREADGARAVEERERVRVVREKAARLEKERTEALERQQKEQEEHNLEQERIRQREQAERAERERQAQIDKERQEAERLERENQAQIQRGEQEAVKLEHEKARVEETERVREEEAKRQAKEKASAVEEMRKSREQSEQLKASTPDRSKATPIRPQSSTPFIPRGRKSALKAPSSQAIASSSPALPRAESSGSSNGSGADLEPPTKSKRKVSFNIEEKTEVTPVRPPILPPSRASVLKPVSAPAPASRASSSKPPVTRAESSPKPSEGSSGK